MPHVWIEDGDYHLIPRITEIVSVMDCEKKASLHPVHTGRSNYYEMSTYVALKGTLVHHKIENYIRQKLQMQPLMLDLSPGDREMYNEVLSDPDKTAWINGQIEIGSQLLIYLNTISVTDPTLTPRNITGAPIFKPFTEPLKYIT